MKVEPLPRIPSPPAHWWRQFRIRLLPGVSFLAVLVAAVWLWRQNMANPLLMGTATGARADVISPQAGRLAELRAVLYQPVKAGDPIAVVEAVDPTVLTNTVRLIHAEMEVIVREAGFRVADKLRYGQYQLDWLRERADLVGARAQLAYAESELQRQAKLFEEQVASQDAVDIARRDAEQARQLVAEKQAAVDTAATLLQQLDPAERVAESPSVKAALAVAEERLRLAEAELQPLVLTAPIDGIISDVLKFPGGIVARAEPIVTIASPKVDRIVGFVGLPIRLEPTVGMAVEVRSRGLHRALGQAQITHVGPRIEMFDAPLRLRGMGNAQQRGLPIVVNVPANMKLRPGELVDLAILDGRAGRSEPN
jgi:multidrug resistance efflux pump